MFLDGTLHPMAVSGVPSSLPEWAKAGVIQDPGAMSKLILEGVKNLSDEMPDKNSGYRDWLHFSRRFGRFSQGSMVWVPIVQKAFAKKCVPSFNKPMSVWSTGLQSTMPICPLCRLPEGL